jgi:glutamate dehydrogenase (NADP+)
MFGQYKKLRNEFTGVLTGKGISFGGSLIRPEATGYGDVYFAQSMLATKGDSFSGKTVVISGSGNVAQYAAEKATQLGGKVVTMSDSAGYIYDADGIDAAKLAYVMEIKNVNYGRISDYLTQYPNAKYVAGKRPWEVKCDIALPCATQNELNDEEAKALIANGCICVAEGANMPSTPEAVEVFQKAKILFAPGKASNAGGVATSGLEMSQNSLRLSWTTEEVDERLKRIMLDIHASCVKYGSDASGYVDYVKGANIAGFVKVADAMLGQGVV